MSREIYKLVRERMLNDLKRDLIGPDHVKDDVITEPPSQAYITGILFPLESEVEQEVFNEGLEPIIDSDESDESPEDQEIETRNKTFKQQSSMGIRFYLNDTTQVIAVEYRWGKYVKSKRYDEERQKDIPIWVRNIEPNKNVQLINLSQFDIKDELEVAENIFLVVNKRRVKGTDKFLVSIFLSNRMVDKNSNNSLFQCEMEVYHPEGRPIFLAENYARKDPGKFEEFLYRHKPIFAKGFGCAASWGNNDDKYAAVVRTEFIPTHEVGSMSTELFKDDDFGELPENFFSIKGFAEAKDKRKVIEKLNNLADRYENWIMKLPIDKVDDTESAELSVIECKKVLKRIRSGIGQLENLKVFKAFTFMNQVMHTQISMKNYSKNRETTSCRRQVDFYTFCSFPFYTSAEKILFRFFIR